MIRDQYLKIRALLLAVRLRATRRESQKRSRGPVQRREHRSVPADNKHIEEKINETCQRTEILTLDI